MGRWIAKEESALVEVKRRMQKELATCPQFPEVVGDRRLIRFIRGRKYDIDDTVKYISMFLKWRKDNNVDNIRQDILYGNKKTPYDFPFGKIIIDLAPQIIISANSIDKKGQPLALECYNFSPKEVLDAITIDDYLVFLTYALEYRSLVMEQMSHVAEQKYLLSHPRPEDREDGYGVVLLDFTIRDLKGIGLGHLGSKGRALVAAALNLGLPNYQEYLGKCHMINAPWLFTTFWYFIKGFLDEDTIAKINFCGSNYMSVLQEDISHECIPISLGGGFKLYNEEFIFDLSIGGPLHYPEASIVVANDPTPLDTFAENKNLIYQTNTHNISDDSNHLSESIILSEQQPISSYNELQLHLVSFLLFLTQFFTIAVLLIALIVTILLLLSTRNLETIATKLFV